jgi:acyl-CoA thioesterase-1
MRSVIKPILCVLSVALTAALAAALTLGANAAAAAKPVRILVLGDSLIQGYGLPPGKDFPNQLERALRAKGANVEVINGGVSGDTSAGGVARIEWSLSDKPDAVIVEFGGNDALRGLAPTDTQRNIGAIIAALKERKIPVLLAGIKSPRNMGADYTREFDAVFPALAKKYGVMFYPFFLDGVAANPALNQRDGIHPNERGVAIIVSRITPMVMELISLVPKRR